MAESYHHRGLVSRAALAVRAALNGQSEVTCFVDGQTISDGMPPLIDEYRPDVYAVASDTVIVGEAKPPWDVESRRSELQLRAFLRYVESKTSRHMVLSVHWTSSATMNCVLRNVANDWLAVRDRVHILDGHSGLILPLNQGHRVTPD